MLAHIMRRTRTPLTMHDSHHNVDVQNGVDENDVMTKIIITDMSANITRRTKTPTLIIMRLMMLIIMMILMFMMIRIMATVIILNMSARILRHTRTRPTMPESILLMITMIIRMVTMFISDMSAQIMRHIRTPSNYA